MSRCKHPRVIVYAPDCVGAQDRNEIAAQVGRAAGMSDWRSLVTTATPGNARCQMHAAQQQHESLKRFHASQTRQERTRPHDRELVCLCRRHHRALEAEQKRGVVGKVGTRIAQWMEGQ